MNPRKWPPIRVMVKIPTGNRALSKQTQAELIVAAEQKRARRRERDLRREM